jgi:hypothetical protein
LLQSALTFLPGVGDAVQLITDAFFEWVNAETEAQQAARELEEATNAATEGLAKEGVQLDLNTAILQDSTKSTEERKAALDELQALYPAYFENIDLEKSSQEDIAAAYRQATNAINLKIKAQALETLAPEKFTEIARQQRDLLKTNAALDAEDEKSKLARAKAAEILGVSEEKLLEIGTEERASRQQDLAKLENQYQDLLNQLKDVEVQTNANEAADKAAAERLKKTGEAAEKAAARRKKAADEAAKAEAARLKAIEKLSADTIKFTEQQAKALSDIQNQITQATINNIEDEGERALAQEKFNFEQRKAQREANFNDILARIDAQEKRLLEVFGENSQEVIDFRKETNEQLKQLEAAFYSLSEQEAIEHEARLKDIEAKGEEQRAQAEQEARAAQIEQLQNNYNLIELALREQLAKGEIVEQEFNAKRLENERNFLQSQLDLLDASDAQYLLKKQELNTKLAELEAKQTANSEKENGKRLEAAAKTLKQIGDVAGQVFGAISKLADASTERQLQKLSEQEQKQAATVEKLQADLEAASGLEKEFIQQQLDREVFAAQQLAKEREKIEKQAAKRRKVIAISEAVINTAISVTQALSIPPGVPFTIPFGILAGALGAAQIAAIAAQPLATGGVVGMNINGAPIKRSNGDDTLTTLKRGEVVLNKRQQSLLGGAKTFKSIGVPGFAAGGVVGTAPTLSSRTNAIEQSTDLLNLVLETNRLAIANSTRMDKQEVVFTPNTQEAIDNDQKDRKAIRVNSTL